MKVEHLVERNVKSFESYGGNTLWSSKNTRQTAGKQVYVSFTFTCAPNTKEHAVGTNKNMMGKKGEQCGGRRTLRRNSIYWKWKLMETRTKHTNFASSPSSRSNSRISNRIRSNRCSGDSKSRALSSWDTKFGRSTVASFNFISSIESEKSVARCNI